MTMYNSSSQYNFLMICRILAVCVCVGARKIYFEIAFVHSSYVIALTLEANTANDRIVWQRDKNNDA